MKRSLLLFGLLLILAFPLTAQEQPEAVGLRPGSPSPYGVHGPHWVGFMTRDIDDGNERVLHASIWYPALNPDGLAEEITYQLVNIPPTMAFFGSAIADAEPDLSGAPYPLVILAHASTGFSYHLMNLGQHLASHGFVAMAVEYEEGIVSGGEFNMAFISRPEDVSRQIDYAEGDEWADLINTDKIAVVGVSFGGLTALNIGGGRLNFAGYEAWCAENAGTVNDPLNNCPNVLRNVSRIAERVGLDSAPEGLFPSQADERVDVIVPIAPPGVFIGAEGATEIDVPTLIIGGTADPFTPPGHNQYPVYEVITAPKSMLMLDQAGHTFAFLSCDDAPWIVGQGMVFICQDAVWDRARSLDVTNYFVTAFLKANLLDDSQAIRLLTPAYVQAPGLIYESTQFGR